MHFKSPARLAERALRFSQPSPADLHESSSPQAAARPRKRRRSSAEPSAAVRGESTALEKPFLRLTEAPDPSKVRPRAVLKEAFALAKRRWREEEDYAASLSQLKAIRQDLAVQHIRGRFARKVYEANARVALEAGDLNEFNQCQTQLIALHADPATRTPPEARDEFLAYRVAYAAVLGTRAEVVRLLSCATACASPGTATEHAVRVARALAAENDPLFWRLLDQAPHMTPYLLDVAVPVVRARCLARAVKAFRPRLSFRRLGELLGLVTAAEVGEYLSSTPLPLPPKCEVDYEAEVLRLS